MTVLVPFDGTALSTAALERGVELAAAFETDLQVLTVIPNGNVKYARERGWLDAGQQFEPEIVVRELSGTVSEIAPDAAFEYIVVGRYAQPGMIASKIRNFARNVGADIVVLGSDNAGRIVTNVSSVAGSVASSSDYDIYVVRHE
jgi:nucleotide-binding universal stress UspA family protein